MIRTLLVLLVSGLGFVLLLAADEPESDWTRLRQMSQKERDLLAENLRRFDRELSNDRQKAALELNGRIEALPPAEKTHQLAVLRRYHNWLNSLPESIRDKVNSTPVGERMALVKKLTVEYPVQIARTPGWLSFVDIGGVSPFELASIFKTWQVLTPQEKQAIERLRTEVQRRESLLRHALEHNIPPEIQPSDFNEEEWAPKVEARLRELRGVNLNQQDWISKFENRQAGAAAKKQQGIEKFRGRVTRRQAINLYYMERPPRRVSSERLARFFAALPPWIQPSFDSYTADDARRRLTLVYRLVFPHPLEFDPPQKTGPTAKASSPSQPPPRLPSTPPQPNRSVPKTPTQTPF